MKLLLVLAALAVSGVLSTPIYKLYNEDHRWTLTKDGDGKMHLLDLNPVAADPEPAFDPEADIFFLLFTRDNPTVGRRININSMDENWRRNHGTRFLIHGWGASSNSGENPRTTAEFLQLADHNVVVVDWSVGAGAANYITARNRVGPTGTVVGNFINWLNENDYLQLSSTHIIGISLGAHVSGHAGKAIRNGRVNAIFGNDPAGPLFNLDNPDRLDFEDAFYTEGLITNGGTLGLFQPITHATFYPNGGRSQPGCGADVGGGCAHGRSTVLYAESVNSNRFVSRQCGSLAEIDANTCFGTGVTATLGGDSAKTIRGIFALETNAQAPFAMG